MTTRLRETAVRRPSLPLSANDERDLALLRTSAAHREALEQLSGEKVLHGTVSEAALLHAVFEAGLTAVREAAEDAGYAQLAAELTTHPVAKATARRRRPDWADEA